MRALGYELWGLSPGFFDARTGRLLQFDGLFFRTPSATPISCVLSQILMKPRLTGAPAEPTQSAIAQPSVCLLESVHCNKLTNAHR